jgi:hypothetical protein
MNAHPGFTPCAATPYIPGGQAAVDHRVVIPSWGALVAHAASGPVSHGICIPRSSPDAHMVFGSGSQGGTLAENRNALCVSGNEDALGVVQAGMMPALPCPMHDDMQGAGKDLCTGWFQQGRMTRSAGAGNSDDSRHNASLTSMSAGSRHTSHLRFHHTQNRTSPHHTDRLPVMHPYE